MTDWSPLGRCRTFQAEIAALAGGHHAGISIGGWGRGLNMTAAEFAELLDHAEIGKAVTAARDALDRRNAGS